MLDDERVLNPPSRGGPPIKRSYNDMFLFSKLFYNFTKYYDFFYFIAQFAGDPSNLEDQRVEEVAHRPHHIMNGIYFTILKTL